VIPRSFWAIPFASFGGLGGSSSARSGFTEDLTAGDAEKRKGVSRKAREDEREVRGERISL